MFYLAQKTRDSFIHKRGGAHKRTTAALTCEQDIFSSPKNPRLQIVLLTIALIVTLLSGSTLAYFTAQDEKVRTIPLATIALSLSEDNWNSSSGIEYRAGLCAYKDPTITATTGNMYTRISVQIQEVVSDGEGGTTTQLITNTERLALIEGILFADPQNVLSVGTPYSSAQISAAIASQGVMRLYNNTLFEAPTTPNAGQYYFNYLAELTQGQSATLFTKVVIPSDYTLENIELMGDFIISIEGQGIQSYGFSNRQDALDELDSVVS